MKKRRYKRKPGDFEIRVLSDGRLVLVAPDETLLEVARSVAPESRKLPPKMEKKRDGRSKKRSKKRRQD
ncbi:MAG: hypothetical protein ACYTEX_18550 [Planctomycetota bacterium]|jgi:hypothetical protein